MSTAVVTPTENLMMVGFGDIPARSKTIASVHFGPMDYKDFWHSRGRSFYLAPGKLGKPSYRKVWDTQQFVPDTAALFTYQAGQPTPAMLPQPVQVEGISRDLLARWQPYATVITIGKRKEVSQKPYRGIIEIAGDVATPDEIKTMDAMQEKHCRALVEEGDRLYRNGSGEITDYHRDCLEWLGSERRDWFAPIEAGQQKKSAISGKRIAMEALADDGIELLRFYIGNGLNPLDFGDTFVDAHLRKNPNIRKTIEKQLGLHEK